MVDSHAYRKDAVDPETVLPKLHDTTEDLLDRIQEASGLALDRTQWNMLAQLEIAAYHVVIQAEDFSNDIRQNSEENNRADC